MLLPSRVLRTTALAVASMVVVCAAAAKAEVGNHGGVGAEASAEAPSKQSLVFYNARIALRKRQDRTVLKTWLLRNALESQRGEQPEHDDDFRSVLWAALGNLALCQDGLEADDAGAGLWPLALYNWAVRNVGKPDPPELISPYAAFDVGRQRRLISLDDVLDQDELRTVRFFRTSCFLPSVMMREAGEGFFSNLRDRRRVTRLLHYLLRVARSTLRPDKVRSTALVEARLFDVALLLTEQAARQSRREATAKGRLGRRRGLSRAAVRDVVRAQDPFDFHDALREADVLRRSLQWSTDEWLSLSPDRRLFLFAQARRLSQDEGKTRQIALAMVDALSERRLGGEAERWLGFVAGQDDLGAREAVWSGERGMRLLSLDVDSGFRERSVIALHRGIDFLQRGDTEEAFRSFAYALRYGEDSREAERIQALSRRWLSYLVGLHGTRTALVLTLRGTVPRNDFNVILEDLAWRAALRADSPSFAACAKARSGRGALGARIDRLRPLADGDLGVFHTHLRDGLLDEPYATHRFLRSLMDRLEAEDGDVRSKHRPTLVLLTTLLAPAADGQGGAGRAQQRRASALMDRCRAMLEGLDRFGDWEGPGASGRRLSPDRDIFVGNVRLAPSDPIPWPFAPPVTRAPSVFVPIKLEPVEWRDPDGTLVFGWEVRE